MKAADREKQRKLTVEIIIVGQQIRKLEEKLLLDILKLKRKRLKG
jgi:hypothetical protein